MARPKSGYVLADGTPVPGSTTIARLAGDASALIGWAGKTCMRAGYDAGRNATGMPRWTDVLYGQRDAAADAGTAGHEMAQAWLRGDDPETAALEAGCKPESLEGGRHAMESFIEWWERGRYRLLSMEEPLVSERHRYGGTYDLLVETDRGPEMLDLKTGGTYPEHLLQVASYGHLLNECKGVEVRAYHLLRITRDTKPDFHHSHFSELEAELRAFLLARELYDLMAVIKKRAK
jgi:hypothetical protein